MTHPYVCDASYSHLCDVAHLYVCDMTHSYVCDTARSYIYDMIHQLNRRHLSNIYICVLNVIYILST